MTLSRLERLLATLGEEDLPPRWPTPPPEEDEPQIPPSRSPFQRLQDEIAANKLRLATLALSAEPAETQEPTISYDDLPQTRKPIVFSHAAPAVFDIGELADEIFNDLPMKDLSNVRLVCRAARSSINTSPKLRRRLFLDPGSIEDIHRDDRVPLLSLIQYPELWAQNLLRSPEAYIPKRLVDNFDPWQIMANPLLVRHCENKNSPLKFRQLPQLRTRFLRTVDDFWVRGMYLTQPPLLLKTSTIDVDSRACETHSKVRRLEENFDYKDRPTHEALGTGKKYGELVEGLKKGMQRFCLHSKPLIEYTGWTCELADVDGNGALLKKHGKAKKSSTRCVSVEQAKAERERRRLESLECDNTWVNDVD